MPSEPIPNATLDHVLTAQLLVAWAGERGEEARLGWWQTDLVSEHGGEDLLGRLLPRTWRWAVLQAVREAARAHDAQVRARHHDADRLHSLFHFGFAIDERLDERFGEHKRSGREPQHALPGLRAMLGEGSWSKDRFAEWAGRAGAAEVVSAPAGRRLRGPEPVGIELRADRLVAALLPLGSEYPLPHFAVSP